MPTATTSMTPTTVTRVPNRSRAMPVTMRHAWTDQAPHAKTVPRSFACFGQALSGVPADVEGAAHPSPRTPSSMNTARNDCQPYTTPATSVVMTMA